MTPVGLDIEKSELPARARLVFELYLDGRDDKVLAELANAAAKALGAFRGVRFEHSATWADEASANRREGYHPVRRHDTGNLHGPMICRSGNSELRAKL